jgi:hypothetical protein
MGKLRGTRVIVADGRVSSKHWGLRLGAIEADEGVVSSTRLVRVQMDHIPGSRIPTVQRLALCWLLRESADVICQAIALIDSGRIDGIGLAGRGDDPAWAAGPLRGSLVARLESLDADREEGAAHG